MKTKLKLIAFVALLWAIPSHAQILIKINVADPDAVQFIAVAEGNADIDSNDISMERGIMLMDVLSGPNNDSAFSDLNGDLRTATDAHAPYDTIFESNNYANGINLFDQEGEANLQTFVSGSPAFSGVGVAEAGFLDTFNLKPVGSTGDIHAGFQASHLSEVIGRWEIVNDALPDGRIVLEEPIRNEIHGGIGNLRGFAVFAEPVEVVEVYIDDEYVFDAPYGGSREDVAAVFGEFPDAEFSGFSLAYGYSNLSPGQHTLRVVARGANGVLGSDEATFTVVTFDEIFIRADQTVNGDNAQVAMDGDEITISEARFGNLLYRVKLKWRTAEQGFEIIEIVPLL